MPIPCNMECFILIWLISDICGCFELPKSTTSCALISLWEDDIAVQWRNIVIDLISFCWHPWVMSLLRFVYVTGKLKPEHILRIFVRTFVLWVQTKDDPASSKMRRRISFIASIFITLDLFNRKKCIVCLLDLFVENYLNDEELGIIM